jgi:hypothetical protein
MTAIALQMGVNANSHCNAGHVSSFITLPFADSCLGHQGVVNAARPSARAGRPADTNLPTN